MKTALVLPMLATLVALILAGCSGSSPVAPVVEEPAPVIKIPKSMVLTSIAVTGFNQNAPDGGDWDWAVFLEDRKPDIRVSLKGTATFPLYNSDTRINAEHDRTYTFTKPASDVDGHLPRTLTYGVASSIYLVDDDPGGDTAMSGVTFNGKEMYKSDNAANFAHTFTGPNGFHVRINGSWVY